MSGIPKEDDKIQSKIPDRGNRSRVFVKIDRKNSCDNQFDYGQMETFNVVE